MDIIKLTIQLIGVAVLGLGAIDKDVFKTTAGIATILLSLTTEVEKNKKRLDKLETQIDFEGRLRKIEEKLKMKKAQLSPQALVLLVIIILIIIWLMQQGYVGFSN